MFPADKCKLLDLNPDDDIDLAKLKKAYHTKMRKYHPDLFTENKAKKMAEAMSKQINEANSELEDIIKKNQH